MHCEDVQDNLADYLADGLVESVRVPFLAHLASCGSCRSELDSLKEIWRARTDIPGEEVDRIASRRRFDMMLNAYIHGADQGNHRGVRINRKRRVFFAMVAAVLALVAAGLFAARQSGLLVKIPQASIPEVTAKSGAMPTQSTETYRGVVKGVIRQENILTPIGNVRIGLHRQGLSLQLSDTTDSTGRFTISDVPAGTYSVVINSPGYSLSSKDAGPTTLTVAPNHSLHDFAFTLVPSVAISGRIVDSDNRPLSRVTVAALRQGYIEGRRALVRVETGPVVTDDHGDFRIFWIPPGEYYVVALPMEKARFQSDSSTAYVASYYPGTTDLNAAKRVTVASGQQLRSLNFAVQEVSTFHVRGRVMDSSQGTKVRSVTSFYLVPHDDGASDVLSERPQLFSNTLRVPVDGQFELSHVLPGSYFLYPMGGRSGFGGDTYMGRIAINVGDQDLDGVEVLAHSGVDVAGKVIVQADKNAVPWESLRVRLKPDEVLPQPRLTYSVNADGTFVAKNIPEGHYTVQIDTPPDAFIVDILDGGTSILDSGITIDGGSNRSIQIIVDLSGDSINGLVRTQALKPVRNAAVVLVPSSSHRSNILFYRTANTDQMGQFTLRGVAPGEYRLFAWDDIPRDAYLNSDFISLYESRGRAVVVRPSARTEFQQLNLILREP